jgi:hypothetical protein
MVREISPFSTELRIQLGRGPRSVVEGVVSVEEVEALSEAGLDAIACHFDPKHPRGVTVQQSVDLVMAAWEAHMETFGVWEGEVTLQLIEWAALSGVTGLVIRAEEFDALQKQMNDYHMSPLVRCPRIRLEPNGTIQGAEVLQKLDRTDWPIVEATATWDQGSYLVPPRSPWLMSANRADNLKNLSKRYRPQGFYLHSGWKTLDEARAWVDAVGNV